MDRRSHSLVIRTSADGKNVAFALVAGIAALIICRVRETVLAMIPQPATFQHAPL
jgi:hypothetical protein